MRSKIIAIASLVVMLMFVTAASVLAAPNPLGTGQPGAPNTACGEGNAVLQPAGFLTDGFAHAASVYAGSPGTPSLLNANSVHAISQYDVACYQYTINHQ